MAPRLISVFRNKEKIKLEHHERMFIVYGTMETLTASDSKGGTFTQILSSVCKENGGAVDILEIEKFVFGSDRSSRSHNLSSFVRSFLTCLKLPIFIFWAQNLHDDFMVTSG